MQYSDEAEYLHRLSVYSQTAELILEHNAGTSSFTLGHNQFSHLTFKEFEATYLSTPTPRTEGTRLVNAFEGVTVPESIDWSTTGAVR